MDHIESAKAYIAIAESEDAKREAYLKAAEEVKAARAEGKTWTQIADGLERNTRYAQKLVEWVNRGPGAVPIAGTLPFEEPGERRVSRDGFSGIVRDPVRRREAIESLTPEERAELAGEALSARNARDAVRDNPVARQRVSDVVHEATPMREREPDDPNFTQSEAWDELPHEIARLSYALQEALGRVPEWLEQYGHVTSFEEQMGALMHDTVTEHKGMLDIAFTTATGNIAEEFSEFLANSQEGR